MGIKFFSFLSLLACSSMSTYAQEKNIADTTRSQHFLEIGLGTDYHAVRDKGTSPLTYEGLLPAIHLQYFISNKRFMFIIDENFYVGNLRTRNYDYDDKNIALSYNNELSFSTLYNVKNYKSSTLYFGGEFGTIANIRLNEKFNNANLNYEIMASLAPSAMLEYRTSWNGGKINLGFFTLKKRDRNFKLQYGLSLPLITTILRPGFVTISDFVDNNSLPVEMENVRVASFDHLFVVKNKFNLYYVLYNNNLLKLNYTLNYFSFYRDFNPVKGFNSAFFVSIVFRFSNNN